MSRALGKGWTLCLPPRTLRSVHTPVPRAGKAPFRPLVLEATMRVNPLYVLCGLVLVMMTGLMMGESPSPSQLADPLATGFVPERDDADEPIIVEAGPEGPDILVAAPASPEAKREMETYQRAEAARRAERTKQNAEELRTKLRLDELTLQDINPDTRTQEWIEQLVNTALGYIALTELVNDWEASNRALELLRMGTDRYTRVDQPEAWGQMKIGMGRVLLYRGKETRSVDDLEQALFHYSQAREVFFDKDSFIHTARAHSGTLEADAWLKHIRDGAGDPGGGQLFKIPQ